MKTEDLKHVFYSGYDVSPDWEILDELLTLIGNGIILYKKKELCLKKNYYDLIDQVKTTEGLGPQGKGHMALKEIAKEFLAEQGLKSSTEPSFLGAHPDILSKDFSWIVECGTTVPVSILFFLRDERIKNIGILPYPYEDEKKLILHVFSRGKNFGQHISSKITGLKTIFEKFHRKNS